MSRFLVTLCALLVVAGVARAEDTDSPHRTVKANGEADTDKCALCHEADMSLSRSKRETCTLCHAETVHSGAWEHLHAAPASVARLPGAHEEKTALPLTDDGAIYCGTCHLFHDPRLSDDKPLAERRPPSATGLPGARRNAITAQWARTAEKYSEASAGAKFAERATKALRLPVDDGTLCRRCHTGKAP